MTIGLHNYEAFFLDHLEGNLNAEQERELMAFLAEHPELKAELESFDADMVLETELVFEKKEHLKKTEVSDEMLIAYVENQVDGPAKKEIEQLAAQNTALEKELKLYKSTVLGADADIKFPRKSRLKRGGVVVYLTATPVYLRVAAAVLLLVGMFFLFSKLNNGKQDTKIELASDVKKNKSVAPQNENGTVPQEEKQDLAVVQPKQEQVKNNFVSNRSVKGEQFATNAIVVKKQEEGSTTYTASVITNTALASNSDNKNERPDSLNSGTPVLTNAVKNSNATHKSYYNYSAEDEDDEDKEPVTASVSPAKKTFFQRVTNAAKRVNAFGLKNVNGEEEENKNSVNIGGLKVSESFSN